MSSVKEITIYHKEKAKTYWNLPMVATAFAVCWENNVFPKHMLITNDSAGEAPVSV